MHMVLVVVRWSPTHVVSVVVRWSLIEVGVMLLALAPCDSDSSTSELSGGAVELSPWSGVVCSGAPSCSSASPVATSLQAATLNTAPWWTR